MWLEAAAAIHAHWPWMWPVWGGVLGGVLGSFLSCAIYRIPRGISLRQPPSQCPHCHTVLRVPELVPVLSWLALQGKCRHCRVAIPYRTLLLEIGCVAAGGWLVWALLP